jgi:F-type H+-transporting ATPase subunit delta
MSTAEAASGSMILNFNLPHEKIYAGAKVSQVIVPGAAGEFGVTADHVPIVAQLKPGVLQIIHEGSGAETEKYFVSGGFSVTHDNSVTDISCPEAVKLDDIDSGAVTSNFEKAKNAFASAEAGSVAQASAQIDMEVNKSMAAALGISLS